MVMELDYDRSLLGKEHEAGPFDVTAETILDFCSAIGETSPVHTEEEASREKGYRGIVAPPTFCTIFVNKLKFPDIQLKFGGVRFLAGQRVESLAPIQAGDSLTGTSHLKDVYPKTGRSGTMVFIVWETIFSNQKGERVAAVQESYAARE